MVQIVIAHKGSAIGILNPLKLKLRISVEQATNGDGSFD